MKTAPDSVLANGVDRATATNVKNRIIPKAPRPCCAILPIAPIRRRSWGSGQRALVLPDVDEQAALGKKAVLRGALQLRPQLHWGIPPGPRRARSNAARGALSTR